MLLSIPGQYSCTFFTARIDADFALREMEASGWSAETGFRTIGANGVWYAFFCDPVTIPIEIEFADPDYPSPEAARHVALDVVSEGEEFYFWPLDDAKFDKELSVYVPAGAYRLHIFGFNPCMGLDDEAIPQDFRSTCEYHRFVFIRK